MTASQTAEERTTELWRDFQRGRAYQDERGLTRTLPLCVKFYEGDQWAAPTKNTKNLPRPVVNITKMICRSKKSSILSTPVRIRYSTFDPAQDVDRFNHFAEYIQKEIGQDAIDKRAISSAVKKGTYIYHYYWDAEARGMNGSVIGGLRCELLEPLNVFFADPTEVDEQKQAWIMIATRESVKAVLARADRGVDKDAIKSDELSDDPYANKEQKESDLVTVLTRYFRKHGEVWCEKATKTSVVNKPFRITPDVEAARASIEAIEKPTVTGEEDPAEDGLPDNTAVQKEPRSTRRADLYPIVVGQYEEREGSIYGMGEVEGIIPNQRAINFNIAMMLLSAQENGWGKYVVSKDALRGQVITNEPGQVLTDFTPGGGGIKRLSDHALPSAPMQIVDSLTSLTRVVTGASEVMTGETLGASMSGAAIAQLQSQALQPVEDLKKAFWQVKEKQGKVLAQFFRFFYAQTRFTYTPEGEEHNADARMVDVFTSAEYTDMDFEVTVEAVGGTNASIAGDINALDTALKMGAISPATYFRLYPNDALSNRGEILRVLESEEANKVAALTAQLEQMHAQMESDRKALDGVGSVIAENERLKKQLAEVDARSIALEQEAKTKISYANAQLVAADQMMREMYGDGQMMAAHIAAERGGKA